MRPNVVIFVADDLGWGDLGCYGSSAIPTPNIDELAMRGARFVDCHATSAVCTPSRFSIMTGMYPWRSPLQRGVLGGTDPAIISSKDHVLAKTFKEKGYATGAFGKWHLGLDWTSTDGTKRSAFASDFEPDMQASGRSVDYSQPFTGGPTDLGFDKFFGIAGSLDMPPYCFLEGNQTVGIPDIEKAPLITSQRPGLSVRDWQDDQVDVRFTQEAVDWIREQEKQKVPFFAYIAAAAPHRPCIPPEFVRGSSAAGPRGDSVVLFDWMVGQVTEQLADLDLLDNTLIIVTSDNGAPLIFPEDGDVENHRPNGTWRGQKGDVWEGGHRIPLVMAGPPVPAGVVSDQLISLLDLAPTLQELVGGEGEGGDGTSLLGLLAGSRSRVIAQQSFDGSLSLRHDQLKIIFSSGSGGFSEPVGVPQGPSASANQIYDLDQDPGESLNRWADEQAAAVASLTRFSEETQLRLMEDGFVVG